MKSKYLLGCLILILFSIPSFFENDESRFEKWCKNLLCPVCQGETIYDSPSEYADDMRSVLKEQIESNLSDQDIYNYWVSRFGERIITNPQNNNFEIIIIPLVISILFVGYFLNRIKK